MQKLKKIFFYILWTAISFFWFFSKQSNGYCMYWVNSIDMEKFKIEKQETFLDKFLNTSEYILFIFWILISPIIFLVWLYFYLTKKGNKERKEKAIKYMKRAVIFYSLLYFYYGVYLIGFYSLLILIN